MKIGLTDQEVVVSRTKFGKNEIPVPKKRTLINLIIESLGDPIIKILLIALAIKIVFMFKDANWYETIGILISIFLATLISTLSEYGSESAFQKLQDENKDVLVKVYRNSKLVEIRSTEIVVGDVIYIESGDIIPSDGIITDGNSLIDESMLSGESKLVSKEKDKRVFKGTICAEGNFKYVVSGVGQNTVYGKIAKEISEKKIKSPLKVRLLNLSKIINKIGYTGSFLVSVSYLFSKVFIANNFNIQIILEYIQSSLFINDLIFTLTLCVTTIVVAVPEGLPMMITLVLSSNMKKLIKDNVLVRKMVGIETSGNINYLLTDKTGTITLGKLEMVSYITPDLEVFDNIYKIKNIAYKNMILESLLYNSSSTINNNNVVGGNSTDQAIMKFIMSEGIIKSKSYKYIPFNSKEKYSKVKIDNVEYVKGAFDILIKNIKYKLGKNNEVELFNKRVILNKSKDLTRKGYRVLANLLRKDNIDIFLGLIVIKDTIRNKSVEGINNIQQAGINVIMITGDYKDTANSIAREVGILNDENDLSFSSEEINLMDDNELLSYIERIKVISRAIPSDKSRIVKLLQQKNYVVGMTGDGVNDAPALKKADVGFAMGSGTSVAKEAADIVILDNNLLSISKAILFGRTIFKSIRKFIVYQLTVNFCALTLAIVGPLMKVNTPITIVQMLWLNMIMDTFAGLAFSFEPSLKKYLLEKPLSKDEPVINKKMYIEIMCNALYSAFVCILFLKLPIFKELIVGNNKYFMTAYFALFIFLGIFNAFNSRTSSVNVFSNIKDNKAFLIIFLFIILAQIFIIYFGGNIFSTFGLKIKDLIFVIILSSTSVVLSTIRKILTNKKIEDS